MPGRKSKSVRMYSALYRRGSCTDGFQLPGIRSSWEVFSQFLCRENGIPDVGVLRAIGDYERIIKPGDAIATGSPVMEEEDHFPVFDADDYVEAEGEDDPPRLSFSISLLSPNYVTSREPGRGNVGIVAGVGAKASPGSRSDVNAKPSVSVTPKSVTTSPVDTLPQDAVVPRNPGAPRDPVPTVPTNPHGASDTSDGSGHSSHGPRIPRIPIGEDLRDNKDDNWLRRYRFHILVVLGFFFLCTAYVTWQKRPCVEVETF